VSRCPSNFAAYFDHFYGGVNSYDKEGVMDLLADRDAARGQIQFRTAAQSFRLIPDEGQRQSARGWGEGMRADRTAQADWPEPRA
jgi:hypothetical protein